MEVLLYHSRTMNVSTYSSPFYCHYLFNFFLCFALLSFLFSAFLCFILFSFLLYLFIYLFDNERYISARQKIPGQGISYHQAFPKCESPRSFNQQKSNYPSPLSPLSPLPPSSLLTLLIGYSEEEEYPYKSS